MGMNRTPIDSSMTIEKAISQGGYYNTDGDWNCIVTLDDYPDKLFRGRVETLVLKDGKLFMYMKDNGNYRIPGGGFDKGVLNKDQAFIETKEEAKLIVDNIRYTGVTYVRVFDENGNEAPAQIRCKKGNVAEIIFIADMDALSLKVYDVRESDTPSDTKTSLKASVKTLENEKYFVKLNSNGDIESIFDKTLKKEILKKCLLLSFSLRLSTVNRLWSMGSIRKVAKS